MATKTKEEEKQKLKESKAREAVYNVSEELKTGLKDVRKLQRSEYPELSQVKPSEIVVGGSLGHGTIVPGNFDVDLVILSRDLTMEDFLPKDGDTRAKRVLKELQKFIERNLKVQTKMKSVRTIFFTKEEDGVPVEIDLLISPYYEDSDDLFMCLCKFRLNNQDVEWDFFYRTLLSPSATKWQTSYISDQPNRALEIVKRVKKWKKSTLFKGGNGCPTSYLLEVLVVEACKNYCEENEIKNLDEVDMSKTDFKEFARNIQARLTKFIKSGRGDYKPLKIYPKNPWYHPAGPNEEGRYKKADMELPYILDPANLYNNLYQSGIKAWDITVEEAWKIFADKFTSPETSPDLTESLFN